MLPWPLLESTVLQIGPIHKAEQASWLQQSVRHWNSVWGSHSARKDVLKALDIHLAVKTSTSDKRRAIFLQCRDSLRRLLDWWKICHAVGSWQFCDSGLQQSFGAGHVEAQLLIDEFPA